jgi:uncharacterized OB-fold protein
MQTCPKCGHSDVAVRGRCPACGQPYKQPEQPRVSTTQKQLLEMIKDMMRAQMNRAAKNGLTKNQVLEAIKEVLK